MNTVLQPRTQPPPSTFGNGIYLAKINRQDFGLTYMSNKLPGGDEMIADLVAITLDVEMVQK